MAAILRDKTPAERLTIAFRMWSFATQLIRRTVRAEHPQWSEAELERHVARRLAHGAVRPSQTFGLGLEAEWTLIEERLKDVPK